MSFTYIIRSDSRNTTSYPNANSFTLKLSGLPTHYKSYDVEFSGFYANDSSGNLITKYTEVQVDNLNVFNNYDSNSSSKTIANNIRTYGAIMKYSIDNFNNREVNFKVVDATKTLVAVTNWVCILIVTPIIE